MTLDLQPWEPVMNDRMRLMGTQSGHDTQASIKRLSNFDLSADRLAISGWRLESLSEALRWLLVRLLDLGQSCGAGPNRDARVAAPQRLTMRRRRKWLGTALMFLIL
jgi:hypothetical protein